MTEGPSEKVHGSSEALSFIVCIGRKVDRESVGSKAYGLARLISKGFPVPRTWAVKIEAHDSFLNDPKGTVERLRDELSRAMSCGRSYAVRSSANVEDLESRSYAGQFETILNVNGIECLTDAVKGVWRSSVETNVLSYSERTGGADENVRMAVLIQEMVPQVISGVAFSINPVTGVQRPVVEAVKGSGELLVQKGLDTARWEDGLLTGATDGIDEALMASVAAGAQSIRSKLGTDIDLEWVYDGESIWWVQVRPVHQLVIKPMYSNRLAKEMLPGQIKPLVWSVNIPLVNGAWVRLFHELTGVRGIDPLRLARPFRYRAYFNMGEVGKIFQHMGLPRESLEIMMSGQGGFKMRMSPRTFAVLPNTLRFIVTKLNIRHEINRFMIKAEPHYDSLIAEDIASLDEFALLGKADALYVFDQKAAYYNILGILFAQMYGRLARRALEKKGIPLESVNWLKPKEKYLNTYPHEGIMEIRRELDSMAPEVRTRVEGSKYAEIGSFPGSARLSSMMRDYLARYGHYSDSGNDFSKVPWREDPEVVWMLVLNIGITDGHGHPVNHVGGSDHPQITGTYLKWVGRRYMLFSDLRERMSSTYTKGYGIFRRYYLELGRRLFSKGMIESPEDIFYLYLDEVRGAVGSNGGMDLRGAIVKRKEEMAMFSDVTLPEVIFGEVAPPFERTVTTAFSGIPSSGGYYKGRVKVVKGISDFRTVEKGDVIIIPFSDVSWSPVFAKAGAVISESGGMLSHSSIVAREYGIPAIVSVKDAMTIKEGSTVIVDGYTGKVSVEG
ncbi:MAG TPA: PEP/pyruvate-binding domain-containing protein [Methanomassiliicoccales archaeon]|nr:PEP/pyruvate-binding domain-containing protein [Methanomassiliicoccales archaeon]